MNRLYPLKFRPILKTLVWGGEKIAAYKGLSAAPHRIGESWELSGVEGSESVVAEGEFAGRTINSLIAEYKDALVGRPVHDDTGDRFPLLIKFIDAHSDLSIQVHPNDALAAARVEGARGKTEMWYIIEASDGAQLLSGLSQPLDKAEYLRRVESQTITEVLNRCKVRPGDVFFLPAGRIHAICSGCFLTEIQQASDITYRIYDYGRPGLDGKPRELHTELAMDAIDYTVCTDYRTPYEAKRNAVNEVVDCKYFTTAILDLDAPLRQDLSETASFLAVVCVAGSGRLIDYEPVNPDGKAQPAPAPSEFQPSAGVLIDTEPADPDGKSQPAPVPSEFQPPAGGPEVPESPVGKGTIERTVTFRQGEVILIPASSRAVLFLPDESAKLLTARVRA